MATKARKTKAKRKAPTTKMKVAKPVETIVPSYLQPGASIRIGLHDVIKALRMIEKHGHLNKLVNAARRQQAQVRVPAETVNFVKDFVAKHGMYKDPVGKHIVNGVGRPAAEVGAERAIVMATTGDPNQCNFGTLGQG